LLLIAIANFAFMNFLGSSLSFSNFISAIVATFLVGFFPVFFAGYVKIGRASRINQKAAQSVNTGISDHHRLVSLGSDSKDQLQLSLQQIWFVEAMQNYVVVHYKDEHQQWQQKIIRSTLSNVEQTLDQSSVIRSHRSFLVNRAKIMDVEGNAQGLKLTLEDLDNRKVPVSRKYISEFQQ
jgi:DNA-binding LytR/AlgR family response regulator